MEEAVTGGWPRCSFAADATGDQLEGTAPQAERWLLVEHPGPWPRQALTALPIDVADALSDWEGRVVLVRRPGRAGRTGPRSWVRVDARPGHESVRTGTYGPESEH